ncbi:hypothetical protein Avbf_02590 [Armadillidium vulgare]|nr:hypothetical protein Avbf_02590 [Armadillidium vulgare]
MERSDMGDDLDVDASLAPFTRDYIFSHMSPTLHDYMVTSANNSALNFNQVLNSIKIFVTTFIISAMISIGKLVCLYRLIHGGFIFAKFGLLITWYLHSDAEANCKNILDHLKLQWISQSLCKIVAFICNTTVVFYI